MTRIWTGLGSGGSSVTPSDTVTGPDAYGDASNPGVSAKYARGDHNHGLPAAPAVAAPNNGQLTPGDYGLLALTGDPTNNISLNLVAATLTGSAFRVNNAITATDIRVAVASGGAGLTGTQGAALYDAAGNLLATADFTAIFGTGAGVYTVPFSVAVPLPSGVYHIATLSAASTAAPSVNGQNRTTQALAVGNPTEWKLAGQAVFPATVNFATVTAFNARAIFGLL